MRFFGVFLVLVSASLLLSGCEGDAVPTAGSASVGVTAPSQTHPAVVAKKKLL